MSSYRAGTTDQQGYNNDRTDHQRQLTALKDRATAQDRLITTLQQQIQSVLGKTATTTQPPVVAVGGGSVSGISNPVPITQGGTGQVTATAGRLALLAAPIAWTVTNPTTTYTVPDSYYLADGDATGGAFTTTLPPSTGRVGHLIAAGKSDASVNGITVAPDGGGDTLFVPPGMNLLAAQFDVLLLIGVTGGWRIL